MALIIILTPFTDGFPGMTEVTEPVFIQTFIAKASIKTLNKSVLYRLAGLDKPKLHAMLKGPLIECAADKFRVLSVLFVAGKPRNSAILSRMRVT